MVREAGYVAAVTTMPGWNLHGEDPFILKEWASIKTWHQTLRCLDAGSPAWSNAHYHTLRHDVRGNGFREQKGYTAKLPKTDRIGEFARIGAIDQGREGSKLSCWLWFLPDLYFWSSSPISATPWRCFWSLACAGWKWKRHLFSAGHIDHYGL